MEYTIKNRNEYIIVPIQLGNECRCLEGFSNISGKLFEFKVPCGITKTGHYSYDFVASIPISHLHQVALNENKHEIILKGEFDHEFFDTINALSKDTDMFATGVVLYNKAKSEYLIKRPSIHFTPNTGWINDPNGLVFDGENYHLYFQYNPFDVAWENMCWGHAISKDLLQWKQLETVLYPDANGTVFSGSGIINSKSLLGLPDSALIFFYTSAGKNSNWSVDKTFTQRVAYSLDGGESLIKRNEACLEEIVDGNRDPKIFWHEESRSYIMVLYLDKNDFVILRSDDLIKWNKSQILTLPEAWECPDIFRLKDTEGVLDDKWIFWSADGFYFFGEFDGYRFLTDGIKHEAYLNKLPYAAQTYSGIDNKAVTIPWLRLPNRGDVYTGAMGLPRELSYRITDKGPSLVQDEVEQLRSKWILNGSDVMTDGVIVREGGPYKLTVNAAYKKTISKISFDINQTRVELVGEKLIVGEEEIVVEIQREITFIADANILEVVTGDKSRVGFFELNDYNNVLKYETSEDNEIRVYCLAD